MAQVVQSKAESRDNLPDIHLPPESRTRLMRALVGKVCSIEKARETAQLPPSEISRFITTERKKQGAILTRPDCDTALKGLSLLLPHATMRREDIDTMLDLYWGLLAKNGVTSRMLNEACERYVMAPGHGKAKFFPDPGQLFDLCRADVAMRHNALDALEEAERAINAASSPTPAPGSRDARAMLAELGEKLKAK